MANKITIIGAGGGMGILFTKYFADMGFEVTGHDIDAVSYTHLTLPTILLV